MLLTSTSDSVSITADAFGGLGLLIRSGLQIFHRTRIFWTLGALFAIAALCMPVPAGAMNDEESKDTPPRRDRTAGHPLNNPRMIEDVGEAPTAGAVSTGNGILYHGGPVMMSTVRVYYIWYGNWNGNSGVALLENLAMNIGGTSYNNINTTYTDNNGAPVSNAIQFATSTTDNYSYGKDLTDAQIAQIVSAAITTGRLPADENGVYFVLTSADVNATSGFCTRYCGWHTYRTMGGRNIKYSFVGDGARCPSSCTPRNGSPNGNQGADGMASVLVHELTETITDPNLNAWYDGSGQENADKCAWTYGTTFAAPNGQRANVIAGRNNYLIQQNWINAGGGGCGTQYVPPTVSAMTPATGAVGSSVAIVLTGTNFAAGASLVVSGAGVTAGSVTVVDATRITAALTIAANATLGTYTIAVKAGLAASAAQQFTVTTTVLAINTLTPATGLQGTTVPVTLAGTNFASGAAVQVSGTGVTAQNIVVTNSGQLTANLVIDPTAAVGARSLTIRVGATTSAAATFTVTANSITLTSVAPSSGLISATTRVTLTGTNFGPGLSLSVSGTGVSISNTTIVSSTELVTQLVVAANAAAGPRNVTVTAGGRTSSAVVFTLAVAPAVTVTGVSPANLAAGLSGTLTIAGRNFVTGAQVSFSGAGVTVTGTQITPTAITVKITIDRTAASGLRTLTVVQGSSSGSTTFTVTPAGPLVTSVTPAFGTSGTTVTITLTGSGFVSGATIVPSGAGITVGRTTVVSATQITAQLSLGGATGPRTFHVVLSSAPYLVTSAPVNFTVNPPTPAITALTPPSAALGASVDVTLIGRNFATGATVAISGSGFSVTNVVVVNQTKITATLRLTATTAVGGRTITVTTPAGTSNTANFAVTKTNSLIREGEDENPPAARQ